MKYVQIETLGTNNRIKNTWGYYLFNDFPITPCQTELCFFEGIQVIHIKTVKVIDSVVEFDIAGDAGFPALLTLEPSEYWYMSLMDAAKYGVG
ncbi:MAG: hypothetical protein LBN97_09290 [Oscillospiraceae bacterium]|jgi:hypothetical protein|nr:hypothetical protein [Oscillospiraceae bacterium]